MDTKTLPECVRRMAESQGDRLAITFLTELSLAQQQPPDEVTYAELYERSLSVAAALRELTPQPESQSDAPVQPRAALLFPPGIDSVIAFLGTQLAGWIPVPSSFPRPHREIPRLNASAKDCQPSVLLSDQSSLETLAIDKLDESLRKVPHLAIDQLVVPVGRSQTAEVVSPHATSGDAIALLQYTSGSTSAARGVVLKHRHVMSNLESIRRGFGLRFASDQPEADGSSAYEVGVFWLPFYHDMGLIGGILAPLYSGVHAVLMSPRSFLSRPIRWLQAISDYRATISGAPNFAYQLAVDRIPSGKANAIDLSCLRLAFCGAEPIQSRTLDDFAKQFAANGFRSSAFYPCYGLAEATLLVTGSQLDQAPTVLSLRRSDFQQNHIEPLTADQAVRISRRDRVELVSCGQSVWNTDLVIVDPDTSTRLPDRTVGEIWVRGGSIAEGYWSGGHGRFDATTADGQSGFCRSGDLGFLHDGNLYVTGRRKEMIVLRGRNLYPQDIEATVRQTLEQVFAGSDNVNASDLAMCRAAAFAVSGHRGEVLAIVAEVPRQVDQDHALADLSRQIRHHVIDVHDTDPHHIWLTRPATINVTTSGKTRRVDCRQAFLSGDILTRYRFDRSASGEQTPIAFPELPRNPRPNDQPELQQRIETWMAEWLVARAGIDPSEFTRQRPLSEFGLDSLSAVELSGETEDWTGVALSPDVATDNPSVASLSRFISEQYVANRGI
ncbi:AMP-binding protein [Roseiconus lacunae]|uniref:AMP-binding protein n=1 Tax=Roseiconus lacunae TaxID=2605694 RepID=UPI0011F3905E|nr:AMP-binding protein [Roseiconus lacunae]